MGFAPDRMTIRSVRMSKRHGGRRGRVPGLVKNDRVSLKMVFNRKSRSIRKKVTRLNTHTHIYIHTYMREFQSSEQVKETFGKKTKIRTRFNRYFLSFHVNLLYADVILSRAHKYVCVCVRSRRQYGSK